MGLQSYFCFYFVTKHEDYLTLTLPAGAIFGPIQSKIDAADNSYCQETSLTGIRPVK